MIDFKKFEKYSRPGPRYTSYPTAPEFSEEFTQNDLKNYYKSQSNDRSISIYIHMPFCRSACYFCGCNTIFTSKEENKAELYYILEKRVKYIKKSFKY